MTEQQKLTFNMLQQQLDSLMLRDRQRFARRLHGVKKVKNPDAQQAIYQEMAKEIEQAAGKVVLREAARPAITYPENLPVSQKKQDILEAIRANDRERLQNAIFTHLNNVNVVMQGPNMGDHALYFNPPYEVSK